MLPQRQGCEGIATSEPQPTFGEEIANSVSHAVGLVAALVAGPFLVARAAGHNDPKAVVGACVFFACIVTLYLASTLYHALPQGKAKRIFRVIEYGAIFLLIAGTYTPFTLVLLHGVWRWAILGSVWILAVAGLTLKAVGTLRYRWLPGVLFLGLAWLIVIAIRPLWLSTPLPGLVWLLLGGIIYTFGMAFFLAKWIPYSHFVWHLFVIAGTVCHFIAVWCYVI